MRRHNHFMKAVAWLLTVTMSVMPIHSYANGSQNQDITAVGKEAQAFGQNLSNSFKSSPGTVQDGTISMPEGSQIDINDLFPGTSQTNNKPDSYYFPDANKPDVGGLQGIYDSDDDMDSVGNNAKGSLWSDAYSDNPSISGAAYKVLLDATNQARPDFSNDPMLNQSKKTYEDIDLIAEGFGDCSVEDYFEKTQREVRLPEYKTCERLKKPVGACTIRHEIEIETEPADIVFLIDNSSSMGKVVADLRNNVRAFGQLIAQGQGGKVRLGGAAIGGSRWGSNNIGLTNVDSFANWVGTIRIRSGQTNPYTAIAWAADRYNWRAGVHRVIILVGNEDTGGSPASAAQRTSAKGIDVYTFHDRARAVGTNLGSYFSGPRLIKFSQMFAVVKDKWGPESCINDAIASLEEFCEGSYSSTPRADNECVYIQGFHVCKGDSIYQKLSTPPIPNVPKHASKVDVSSLVCDYNKGVESCWVDPNGNEQCLDNPPESGDYDRCQVLEENPECGFISSECVDGAVGSYGNCYVRTEIYDCGTSVQLDSIEKAAKYQCGGEIRCMGNDCLDPPQGSNQTGDFAKASALLNAAQFMTQDMTCTDVTGQENMYCTAFGGEPGECKIAVGGVQDCCEKPSNVSMFDYLMMIRQVPKLDGAILSLEGKTGGMVKSAYQSLRDPVKSTWSEVTQPFTNSMDNISGAVDKIWSPIEEFKDELINKLKEETKKIFQDVIGNLAKDGTTEAAATGMADQATEKATNEMATQAGSMLGAAMTIYTAYVVTVAIIQMVWACEQKELEMNAKRAVDSCTYVGSYCKSKVLGFCIEKRQAYCCFNSPLSRIIQEQVRPQFGQNFGSAKNPRCEGIPLDRISEIDWNRVNLDEWLAILQRNGQFPNGSNVSMDALTGSGSVFNIDGDRLPADQRAMDRVDGIDVDAKRREAMEGIGINPGGGGHSSGN